MKRGILCAAAALLGSASALAQTAAPLDRSVLPIPAPPFDGAIAEAVLDSRPGSPRIVRAPDGAPNVLLMMSDDVGFAMSSAFGGPVPTPNYEALAAQGQRYNRFHTTGICSPSRAALLTGRNHHNAGVGFLSDLPANYPGYGGRMLPETATIAQTLRLNGYSTAMFGKHHNVPSDERSEAGPFDNWPTGLGFEYFFGFVHGDVDQYAPSLHRGTSRVAPDEGKGDLLDKRLADDIIRWVHNQKAAAPDKPFLVYFAPGSAHAPHQAPAEYIARFKGRFDMGWDRIRQDILRRQIAMGVAPRGTRLTPRPDGIPAWDSLTPGEKAFAARSMEVAAAQLAYQDEQLGRVIAELRRMGQLDNTLIVLVHGDNGASGEAGPKGTINELRGMGAHDERQAWLEASIDRLGGETTYGNYPVGWAWAMNTPLRWVKQFGSMLGGVRNGMILSWGQRTARPGAVCGQFSHLIDIAPTVLEAARLTAPARVYGVAQKPIDGQSLLPSLAACDADKPRTQYFEMTGKAGLYHDGWFLSGENGRPSWENRPPAPPPARQLDALRSAQGFLARHRCCRCQSGADAPDAGPVEARGRAEQRLPARSPHGRCPGRHARDDERRAQALRLLGQGRDHPRHGAGHAAGPFVHARCRSGTGEEQCLGGCHGAGQSAGRLESVAGPRQAGVHLGAIDRSGRNRHRPRCRRAAGRRRQADNAFCRERPGRPGRCGALLEWSGTGARHAARFDSDARWRR